MRTDLVYFKTSTPELYETYLVKQQRLSKDTAGNDERWKHDNRVDLSGFKAYNRVVTNGLKLKNTGH